MNKNGVVSQKLEEDAIMGETWSAVEHSKNGKVRYGIIGTANDH